MSGAVDVPTPADPLDARLTSERVTPPERAAPRRLGVAIPAPVPGLAAAMLAEAKARGEVEAAIMAPGNNGSAIEAAEEALRIASAEVARLQGGPPAAPDQDALPADAEARIRDYAETHGTAPADDDWCGCGAAATWHYNVTRRRGLEPGEVAGNDDEIVSYCAKHGPNTPPIVGTNPARPVFACDEQVAAYEELRDATEALHAAELAHQQQAAALHAAVLAPAQVRFRNALTAWTQSIAPGPGTAPR